MQANCFVEWSIAMTHVLAHPDEHDKFLAPNLEANKVKGAEYKVGVVTKVDTSTKAVCLKDGDSVPYDALVVATGFDLPLINAAVGCTLAERKAEIQTAAAAIKAAQTVVINGGGPVGLELAGDIRAANASKRVVLLVRGSVLSQWPEKMQQKAMQALSAQNIEVLSGASGVPEEVSLEPGTFTAGDAEIAYDVFIPAYSRGPNTKFLQSAGVLDDRGCISVNEFLQSKICPEIFPVGVSDLKEPSILPKLDGQWKSATANVKNFLSDKALKKHSENMPVMKLPVVINIGAWSNVDFDNAPFPLQCCCCCGVGGFPFCPPPCCWPCCKPCMCGYCGGQSTGAGPASCMGKMRPKAPTFHFKGLGEAERAPEQQSM